MSGDFGEAGLSPEDVLAGARADPIFQAHADVASNTAEPIQTLPTPTGLSREELEEALDRVIDRRERNALIRLRDLYSYSLAGILGVQLIFMNVLVAMVATNTWHLSSAIIQVYLTGTLGEIFGLVTIATTFVFSDKDFLGSHRVRKKRRSSPTDPPAA